MRYFKSVAITLLLVAASLVPVSGQTIYYSWVVGGGPTDVTDLDAWRDDPTGDGSGIAPADFSDASAEYHIINADAMDATGIWTLPSGAKLVIEDGSIFDNSSFNHSITVDMLGSGMFVKSGSSSYTGIQFGSVATTSIFVLSHTSGFRTNLAYPNLQISAPSGAVTLSSALTVNGDLEISSSAVQFRGSATATHTIGGSIKLNAGTFIGSVFSGNPTYNIGGNIEVSGGTFNGNSASTGIATFNITGSLLITSGSFNGVSGGSGNPVYNLGGDFTHSGGTYRGVNSGTGIPTFNMNGISSITAGTLTNSNHNFVIANNVSLQSSFTVGKSLTLSSGLLSIGANTLTLNDALTITSGSLVGGLSSSITFASGTVGANLPAVTLANLSINRSGQQITMTGSVTVGTLLSISAGTLSIGSNTLTLNGAFTSTGTLTGGATSNITVGGLAAAAINLPAVTLNDLTVNRTNGIGMDGAISVGGTLTLTAGQIDNSISTLTLGSGSNIIRDVGSIASLPTFSGTVNVTYTGSTSVNSGNELPNIGSALNNLTIGKTGGVTLAKPIQVNGTFTINSSCQFAASNQPITVMAGWVNNNVFDPGTGTVNFNGTTTLSGSGTHNFYTVSIGGALTVPASGNVSIAGNFANNGTFTHNSGTLTFNGSGSQTISGTTVTNFNNLTITKSSLSNTVSLGSSHRLIGTLTLSNGTSAFVTTGQTFTLVSNASGTARIASIPTGATITGEITMQRYIPASGRYWYNLASPVADATVSEWQTGAPTNGFYITGSFTGASNPGNGIISSTATMFNWSASAGTWAEYPNASNGEALSPKVGYRVFIRDGGTSQAPTTSAKTISVSGSPNMGNQSYSLSYNAAGGNPPGGWNLLGNPYPSDISANLNNSGWAHSGLAQTAVYIWDSNAQTYVSCNSGTGDCIIPSSQGFWVQTSSGGATLSSTENVKVTGSTTIYKTAATDEEKMAVKLTHTSSNVSNSAYIRYVDESTNGFDPLYDAYKLDNIPGFTSSSTAVSIASKTDTLFYSINSKPVFSEYDTIPLYLVTRTGANTLDFSDIDVSSSVSVYLIDNYTNTVTNVKANPVYLFNVTTDPLTSRDRFSIVFTKPSAPNSVIEAASKKITFVPNPTEEKKTRLIIKGVEGEDIDITILDISGKVVFQRNYNIHNGNLEENLNLEALIPGLYTLKGKTEKGVYTQKLVVE